MRTIDRPNQPGESTVLTSFVSKDIYLKIVGYRYLGATDESEDVDVALKWAAEKELQLAAIRAKAQAPACFFLFFFSLFFLCFSLVSLSRGQREGDPRLPLCVCECECACACVILSVGTFGEL